MNPALEEFTRLPEDDGTPRESQGRKRLAARFAAPPLACFCVNRPVASIVYSKT